MRCKATYVDGGDGIALVLCVLEELEDIVASDDTGLAGENLLEGDGLASWSCRRNTALSELGRNLRIERKPLCMSMCVYVWLYEVIW